VKAPKSVAVWIWCAECADGRPALGYVTLDSRDQFWLMRRNHRRGTDDMAAANLTKVWAGANVGPLDVTCARHGVRRLDLGELQRVLLANRAARRVSKVTV
jgi:hypothetical protein